MKDIKPKSIKGLKIEYDGETYENILSFSKGYDYGSFNYLDSNGSECSVYLRNGQDIKIIND